MIAEKNKKIVPIRYAFIPARILRIFFVKTAKNKLSFFCECGIMCNVFCKIRGKVIMNLLAMLNNLLIAEESFAGSNASYTAYRAVSLTLIICMGVAALAAIVLVMLQPGNSQGIDALGGSSETFYGKNKGKSTEAKLKLWTIICLAVLTLFAIAFFIVQIPGIWGLAF